MTNIPRERWAALLDRVNAALEERAEDIRRGQELAGLGRRMSVTAPLGGQAMLALRLERHGIEIRAQLKRGAVLYRNASDAEREYVPLRVEDVSAMTVRRIEKEGKA